MLPLSVVIPTCNRRNGWWGLLDSLYRQTRTDFECIIVDDGSTDGTVKLLSNTMAMAHPPFAYKVIRSLVPRSGELQTSAVTDNIGFREARGTVVLHLNDDLRIGRDMVKHALTLGTEAGDRVVWGAMVYVGDDWQPHDGIQGFDSRVKRARALGIDDTLFDLPESWNGDWGAVYVVATRVLRDIGGHDLNHQQFRGVDCRLGWRLRKHGLRSYLCCDRRFTVAHQGRPWFVRMRDDGRGDAVDEHFRSPLLNMKPENVPVIANGGVGFWSSAWFDGTYEIVSQGEGR